MKKNDLKVIVFNRQRKIPIDTRPLDVFARQIAARLNLTSGFSVTLVSDSSMERYNRQFRGKDQPTDVLSFPYDPEGFDHEDPYMGDIVISAETAERQKRETLIGELKVLCLHGVLHLMGHDHETDAGQMKALEQRLKEEFRLN
ncbi:MAG: rRNA maturation RNase YbeY [Acidobacteriota bacterium]